MSSYIRLSQELMNFNSSGLNSAYFFHPYIIVGINVTQVSHDLRTDHTAELTSIPTLG
jgi:hypothetical protein